MIKWVRCPSVIFEIFLRKIFLQIEQLLQHLRALLLQQRQRGVEFFVSLWTKNCFLTDGKNLKELKDYLSKTYFSNSSQVINTGENNVNVCDVRSEKDFKNVLTLFSVFQYFVMPLHTIYKKNKITKNIFHLKQHSMHQQQTRNYLAWVSRRGFFRADTDY